MICWDVTDNWRNLFEIEGHVNPILGQSQKLEGLLIDGRVNTWSPKLLLRYAPDFIFEASDTKMKDLESDDIKIDGFLNEWFPNMLSRFNKSSTEV